MLNLLSLWKQNKITIRPFFKVSNNKQGLEIRKAINILLKQKARKINLPYQLSSRKEKRGKINDPCALLLIYDLLKRLKALVYKIGNKL